MFVCCWVFFGHLLYSLVSKINFNWKLIWKYLMVIIHPQRLHVDRMIPLSINRKIFSQLKHQTNAITAMVRKAIGDPENKDFTSISKKRLDLSEGVRTCFWTILDTCTCHNGKGLQKIALWPVAQEAAQNVKSPHENCLTYLSKALAQAMFVPYPNQTLGCSAAASFSLRKESKPEKSCRISCLIMFSYPPFPFPVLC